ncbi:unnamed protein product [Amaranthus hypochondriacus]
MLLHLGSLPTLIVSSARAAREIMVTQDIIFANRPKSKKADKFFYNYKDIGTAPYGEYWRQVKGICIQHLLNNKTVRSFRREREEEITLMIEKITQSTYLLVNLSELFKDFTNDMICRVVFGMKYSEKEGGMNFNKFMNDFTESLAEFCFGDFIPWLAWIDGLRGWDAKVDNIFKEFDEFVERVIHEHQDRLDSYRMAEDGDNKNEKVKDFVDVLLDYKNDHNAGVAIDHIGVKAVILNMFAAGTDTTSSLLEWTMAELLRHPQVLEELQKEVRTITGKNPFVKEEDLEQMKYLKAVIKETLRLHPTVPLLAPHESTKDTKINCYHIPAKTTVLINAWAIHRDPSYWDDPEMFVPERFLKSQTDYRGHDLHFIPFGAGRRICPGISFAMASTELLIANLIHKFDWRLPDGVECSTLDMSECFTISMHKNTPLLAAALPPIACRELMHQKNATSEQFKKIE